MLVLAVLCGLRAAGVASAAGLNFVVNDTSDSLDANLGDGLCRTSAGTCTLRAAIQQTNAIPGADEIELGAGTYELGIPPLNQNDVTTGDLDITDSLTISGAGAGATVVDGGTPPAGAPIRVYGLDRLFEVLVDGGTVTLAGLTVRDGYAAEYGGAIANNSTATVTVTDSALAGNVADKAGGAIDNHLGGAVVVRDSSLTGNFAFEGGSAINNNREGSLKVTNSTVSANSAATVGLDETLVGAGAISNNAELDARGTITIAGSQISDNVAGGGRAGAGISNDGAGTLVVDRTTFLGNRSTADGGAIFNGSGDVTVTGTTFSQNDAKDGGAVASSGGSMSVLDSTFSTNSAEALGGAVYNGNTGSATIQNVTFSDNSALTGGGFSNEGTGVVTIENSTFTKNTAIASAILASGEGGGMHSNSGGDVVITGGAFTENTARGGGGLSNEGGGQVTITGTRFAANHAEEAGGGILVQSGAVRMVDIDVIRNVSSSSLEGGGGISYHGDKSIAIGESAAIENSRIRDNKSNGDGGGVDSRGDGPLAITTTAITGNTAAVGGGIHHVGDAPLLVTRSTLSGNSADSGGAAFTDGDGEATFENTTVSGNRADRFGGGLLVSARLTVKSSTVANNFAPSGGGINNGGGDLVGDGLVFLANTIVASNPTGGNCAGTITSLGGNIENATSCQLGELSDQPGTDPLLGELADNGGPTQTQAMLAGSPAQEKAVCTVDPCPSVDQRGIERPQFAASDVGAYESELTPGGDGPQQCAGLTERPVSADFDSWVSQSSQSANFGSDAILNVSGNGHALVHFALPPVPPGCRLVGATLRLYFSSATDGQTVEARRLSSAWSELGVTWANQPATAGQAATTQSGLGLREWDVLAQALDMYTFGDYGFLIRDGAAGSGAQSFHSREKGTDSPELMLIFDDPDAPPRPGLCPTSPQSLSADRDSWVSEGSPSNNFGSDSTLKVKSQGGGDARTLVRFPLPALPNGCTSIASAILRLEASSARDGHTLQALQVASTWSETGVTWSNQPATTGPAATTLSAQGPLEWTVTEQVLAMYIAANHGFLLRDADENGVGDEQTLNSRDKVSDGPPELVLVFDDSTPETEIHSGPVSPTDATVATFSFSSDQPDATFECSLDGTAFQACASPHAVHGVTEGSHTFQVRATRKVKAVDPTPASYSWTVEAPRDVTPPQTAIASGPPATTTSTSASFGFSSSEAGSTFACALDGAAFAACASPREYAGLAVGEHQFLVRASDAAGNTDPSPASYSWTIHPPPDTTAPDTTITSQPANPSTSTSASFDFAGSDNATPQSTLVFQCRLDSEAASRFVSCFSPRLVSGLSAGSHTFDVRAVDTAGNADPTPASYTWTVDPTAPETTIVSGPAATTASTTATFTFSASEQGSFACRLDDSAWASCTSPRSYSSLAAGGHTFDVRATDAAGNEDPTPATRSWMVQGIDTTAPETTIGSGPAASTTSTAASFTFTSNEPGSTFACSLDDAALSACASPASYAALAQEPHRFRVQARDAAGNLDLTPAEWSWTIVVPPDTTAPETTLESGPGTTSETAATFTFSASEAGARFECALDGAAWAGCSSPHGLSGLSSGSHTFSVRALDAAGNPDPTPALRAWTISEPAPTSPTPPPSSGGGGSGGGGPDVDTTAVTTDVRATVTATVGSHQPSSPAPNLSPTLRTLGASPLSLKRSGGRAMFVVRFSVSEAARLRAVVTPLRSTRALALLPGTSLAGTRTTASRTAVTAIVGRGGAYVFRARVAAARLLKGRTYVVRLTAVDADGQSRMLTLRVRG